MKLFEAPRNSWVRVVDTGEQFFFQKIDGMYSVCLNHTREIVHLAAWTEIEVIQEPAGKQPFAKELKI